MRPFAPTISKVPSRRFAETTGLPLKLPRTWTNDEVIATIQARRAQGLRLIGVWEECPPLYRAAKKLFGGWRLALLAAGVPAQVPQRWTRSTVLAGMHRYREQGRLSRVWREDKPLFAAAGQHFGNWNKALQAAGLPSKPRRRWSKELVIQELRAWRRVSGGSIRRYDPALLGAAARLETQQILDDLREWNAAGHSLRWRVICLQNRALATAAKSRFRRWRKALLAADITVEVAARGRPPTWNPQRIIEHIRHRQQEGKPLHEQEVERDAGGLLRAAREYSGSWSNALTAAGLDPAQHTVRRRTV